MARRMTLACVCFVVGCFSAPPEAISLGAPNATGVSNPERLTDGMRAFDGAPWDSTSTARFRGRRARVDYDLGASTQIGAAYLQGDNNDTFILEASEDGQTFEPVWTATPRHGTGLRARWGEFPPRNARYLRLRAEGGDAAVTAAELQVFTSKPTPWPPWIRPTGELATSWITSLALFAFALIAILALAAEERASRRVRWAAWGVTAAAAVAAVYAIVQAWPLPEGAVNAARAVAGIVAAFAVLRIGVWHPLRQTRTAMVLLGAMAVLAVSSFYNFGHGQFWDHGARHPTYVHAYDLRVYFPSVKYFEELGYDGVYLASVQAYSEDALGGTLRAVEDREIRDLRDYEMRPIGEIADEVRAVRSRFTDERWSEFKHDMAYFWKQMGRDGYFRSLSDHGGNATPTWMLVARLLYGEVEASDRVFLAGALLDPLLLLVFFVVAWRTFGLLPTLACAVVFGATTFYQLGSNWSGATLRNDWMALLGLGICALHRRRFVLAGVLLGWSAMIRAFPLVAIVFTGAWLINDWRRAGRDESKETGSAVSERADALRSLAKLTGGVAAIAVLLALLSSATFGFQESWVAWTEKIGVHANDPNINHVGVTALVGFKPSNLWDRLRARGEDPRRWTPLTQQTVRDRWWLRGGAMLLFTLLAWLATVRHRASDAAIIGTMMLPVYFYPSNYYLHCVFLWPLLLASREAGPSKHWAAATTTWLTFCAVQWFGWLIPGRYGQFLLWSGLLLAAMVIVLVIAIRAPRTPQPIP